MFRKSDNLPDDSLLKKYSNLFSDSPDKADKKKETPLPDSQPSPAQKSAGNQPEFNISGIPESVPENVAAVFRAQLNQAIHDLVKKTGLKDARISISTPDISPGETDEKPPEKPAVNKNLQAAPSKNRHADELSLDERAGQFRAHKPLFSFEFLAVSEEVKETLLSAIDVIRLDQILFHDWNLKTIEPFPRSALNFYGPPGTGKTLAAHALAHYIGAPILTASYAQIESKYHGEGPKNVEALFLAAQRDKAVLFIDEADSLLSRRISDVTQASEQAINSMRGQLMVSLERYEGVVIFATNLIENYDKAFETRIRYVHFPLPDEPTRREIWKRHLPKELPLDRDVSVEELAKIEDVCGRDIKNAVIDAAIRAARNKKPCVAQQDLAGALERIKSARIEVYLRKNSSHTVLDEPVVN